eukprot:MONOS_10778.2-p1 / transcript=MONOS_10778.2 / gene=MONOS_10778 / organism=Monocercomonoides_exilis_PA203 / gene_product=Sugar Porter (SP) Family MFS Transporter / transcript_product=Sugar Porter (SP) Family MFS Transporter / location=Mono_scaffold00504:19016-20375(-) / protein_length=392 / sequence_SO=supercontig / SO=protein_coding / is_pseudo=false
MLGGFLSDKLGPKKMIAASAILIIICAIILAVQSHVASLLTFRAISGLGIGVISVVAPVYISEQSPAKRRGRIVSLYQVSLIFSTIIAYGINYFCNNVNFGWRYEFGSTGFFPLALVIIIFILPESGRWKEKQAAYKAEAPHLKKGIHISHVCRALFSSKRAVIVGLVLASFTQLTGINCVMMFSPSMLGHSGLESTQQKLGATILVGLWNFLSTLISVLLVDFLGRVPLLIAGFGSMAVGLFVIVLSYVINGFIPSFAPYTIATCGIALFVLGFEIGPGPVFYVLTSELYPQQYRGTAMSVISVFNWLANVAIVFSYLPLVEAIGSRWVFTVLCVFCLGMVAFVVAAVPETKQKSLEDIESEVASNEERAPLIKQNRQAYGGKEDEILDV